MTSEIDVDMPICDKRIKVRVTSRDDGDMDVEIVSDKNEKAYSDFVAFLGIDASEMIMVGNSFKSDIAPVLAIGGYGAYIPFHTTWQHERAEEYSHPRLIRLDSIGQLPGMLLQATMPESSGNASII